MRLIRILPYVMIPLVLLPESVIWAQKAAQINRIQEPVTESIVIRQNTQEHEEQWRIDKQKMLIRYDQLKHKEKQLTELQQTLDEKVENIKIRIGTKQNQLDDIEHIQAEITPVIENLIKELGRFVAGDLPFLIEERRERIQRLVQLRDDPEVSVSEKFRKVMEAQLESTSNWNTAWAYDLVLNRRN